MWGGNENWNVLYWKASCTCTMYNIYINLIQIPMIKNVSYSIQGRLPYPFTLCHLAMQHVHCTNVHESRCTAGEFKFSYLHYFYISCFSLVN